VAEAASNHHACRFIGRTGGTTDRPLWRYSSDGWRRLVFGVELFRLDQRMRYQVAGPRMDQFQRLMTEPADSSRMGTISTPRSNEYHGYLFEPIGASVSNSPRILRQLSGPRPSTKDVAARTQQCVRYECSSRS